MAAPLPPDMEDKSQKLSRRLSSLSMGVLGFVLGTAFGVGFSSVITTVVSGLGVFITVAGLLAFYWYLAKGKTRKIKKKTEKK